MLSLENKRIVVTGGCGFIGLHAVEQLLSYAGTQIIVLDSAEYGDSELLPKDPRVRYIQAHLEEMDIEAMSLEIGPFDYLIHLAAYKHNQSSENPERFISANVLGTYRTIELAARCGAKKAAFSSTLYAYGHTNQKPAREDWLPTPTNLYGVSKVTGEHLFRWGLQHHNLPYSIVRFFFVYGPRQYPGTGYKSVIIKSMELMHGGQSPIIRGDGEQTLDYIYVTDAVDGIIKALLSGTVGGIYNIGSGKDISINDLVGMMQNITGFTGTPAFEPKDETHDTTRVGDVTKAQAELGFKAQTPIEEGLKKTYEWVASQIGR